MPQLRQGGLPEPYCTLPAALTFAMTNKCDSSGGAELMDMVAAGPPLSSEIPHSSLVQFDTDMSD